MTSTPVNMHDLKHYAWLLWGEELGMINEYGKKLLNCYRMFHSGKVNESELIKQNPGRTQWTTSSPNSYTMN